MGGFVVYDIAACLNGEITVDGNRKRWQDCSDIQPAGQNGNGQVLLDFITPVGGVECGISCCSLWKVVTEIAEA